MTIQTDSRITSEMLTDGLNNTFSFDFPIFKGDNGQKGVEVRFMNDLGYEIVDPSLFLVIEDSDNTSGMVQFYVPPIAGKRLLIAGKTPIDQQLDITNASRFNGKSIETNFDKIVSMIQEFISSLDEEIRQRINNNEELRNKLDLIFAQYISEVDARFNSKWTEIAEYLNATLPMFFCIMRKEIDAYSETGLIDVLNTFLEEKGLSQLIDEYIASLDQDFIINTKYFSGAFEFDPDFVAAGGKYPVNTELKLDNGDIVKSIISNNVTNPNIDMTGWELVKNQTTYTSKYNLKDDPQLDQSAQLQAIVDKAKSKSKILIIDSISPVVYAVMNVDIAGLNVEVSPNVSFIAPLSATNQYTFIAIGTAENYVPKTILKNAKLDAANRMRGVFEAEYVNDPQAPDCGAINVPTGVSPDGSGIIMKECIRPRVKGGYFHGGRQGVLFTSCTNPVAEDVKTEHQGRDGILFYTDPSGTTTTDADSINCKATDFCINGEAGRAGIHFYGVRRAKATTPTASNDNNQIHDDTAAVRFRDCEDYYTDGYDAENVRTGVLANEIGDYSSAPHNIVVRGAFGAGNIKNTRKFGVCAATPTRVCSIVGAVVSDSGKMTGGAGIYSAADGGITGCFIDGTTEASGIYSAGKNTITGNVLKNAGKSSVSIAQITVTSESVVSGNSFENSDTTSALAIRAIGVAKVTIGSNSYDANTTQQVLIDSTATLKRGSALIRTQFAGFPSVMGIFENGVQICDTNGVIYNRDAGAWKRQTERTVTATIGTTQTTVAHGLGYIPTVISILVKSNANVWQSAVADITNIYLTASIAATSVDISCR